jgi:putative phosphoesterase
MTEAIQRTYRVGIVSDTHVGDALPALPEGIAPALAGVDLILHAGDVTTRAVLDRLAAIAPVVAVRGNHDTKAGLDLPAQAVVAIGGVRIGVTHGLRGRVPETAAVLAGVARGRPVMAGLARTLAARFREVDCVVFGHFHVPYLAYIRGTTVFSPGAVYVAEADPFLRYRGIRGRAFHRFRAGLPTAAHQPHVGILEIADRVVTPRFVPLSGDLRATASAVEP